MLNWNSALNAREKKLAVPCQHRFTRLLFINSTPSRKPSLDERCGAYVKAEEGGRVGAPELITTAKPYFRAFLSSSIGLKSFDTQSLKHT